MTRRARMAALLAATVLTLFGEGCASAREAERMAVPRADAPVTAWSDPIGALEEAGHDLADGRFASARRKLHPLAWGCAPAPADTRRRAALLLAAAELDVTNRRGTPDEAALLAAQVLRTAPVGDADLAIARALYLLALDRGAHAPTASTAAPLPVEGSSPGDDEGPGVCRAEAWAASDAILPEPPGETTADRLNELREDMAEQTDSLAALRERLADSERRSRALGAEIERIRQLLVGGLDTLSTGGAPR